MSLIVTLRLPSDVLAMLDEPRVDEYQPANTGLHATSARKRSASIPAIRKSSRRSKKTKKARSAEFVINSDSEDDTIVVNVPKSQSTASAPHNNPTTDLAQDQMHHFQLADLLIKFIFQLDTDTTVLDLLADEWSHNKEHYRTTTKDLYESFDAVFFEWLQLQQAIIEFKFYGPLSELTLKEKGQRMLARNQLRSQHCRWTGLTYQVRGKVLEGVQMLSLMLCNVVAMLGTENVATYEGIKSLLEG